jgi:hypothetical protein
MGNHLSSDEKDRKLLEKDHEIKKLKKEIDGLKKKYSKIANITTSEYIDKYIDNWFEQYKDDVDVGEVTIAGSLKIDLLPDELEKRIYKKAIKIALSLLADFNY